MKPIIFTLALLFSALFQAQIVDAEDRDDSFILDNNKNILKFDISLPFYQIRTKGCADFQAASFEGGAEAYKNLLTQYMYAFLNSDYYTLNGTFTFTLSIDQTGKVTDLEGFPKIANSDVFFDDMQYVVRRIKKNWTPAKCDGNPVASHMQIKMNFSSVSADL